MKVGAEEILLKELIERFLTVGASDIEIFLPAVDPSGGGRTIGAA